MGTKEIKLFDIECWLIDNINNDRKGYCKLNPITGLPYVEIFRVIRDLEKEIKTK